MSTTTEVKHTPGPWSFHLGRGAKPRFHIQTAGGYQVACTTEMTTPQTAKTARDFDENNVREANARLLAAAPELLAALQSLVAMNNCNYGRDTDDYQNALDAARAAIAKATGSP